MSTAEATKTSLNNDPEYRGLHIVVRENKSGTTYHLRWNQPMRRGVGQYIYLGRFGSEKQVLDARKRAKYLIMHGTAPTPAHFNGGIGLAEAPTRKRLEDVAEGWFAANVRSWKGKGTPKNKRGYMRRVVGYFEDFSPYADDINLARAREFYELLEAEGMKPVSIGNLTSCIKGILDFAEVPDNPFRNPLLIRPSGSSDQKPIPTNAAVRAQSLHLTGDYLMLHKIMENTGLRPDNACILRWENVTPTGLKRVLNLKKSAQRKRSVYIESIPVLDFQIEDGHDWLPVRPEGVPDSDFIVGADKRKVDKDGNPVPAIDSDMVYRAFRKAAEKAAKDAPFPVEYVNPYAFRHLHESRLHEWGATGRHTLSAKQQADRLGHELNQADKHYIVALPTEPAEFAEWWATKS